MFWKTVRLQCAIYIYMLRWQWKCFAFNASLHLVIRVLQPLHVSLTFQLTLPNRTALRQLVDHLSRHRKAVSLIAASVGIQYVTFHQLTFCCLELISYSAVICVTCRRKHLKQIHSMKSLSRCIKNTCNKKFMYTVHSVLHS